MPKPLSCYYHNQERCYTGDQVLYKRCVYTVVKYKKGLLKIVQHKKSEKVHPTHVALLSRDLVNMDQLGNAKEKVYTTIVQDQALFKEYTRISGLLDKTENDFNRDVLLDALYSLEDRAIALLYCLESLEASPRGSSRQ